ncbi:MAG: hypothetical protein AAGH41_09565 [Pseudomonadota bacterium]
MILAAAALAASAVAAHHDTTGEELYEIRYETRETLGADKRHVKMTFTSGLTDEVVEMGHDDDVYFRMSLTGEGDERTASFFICAKGSDPCEVIGQPNIAFEKGKRAKLRVKGSIGGDGEFDLIKISIRPTHRH